MRTADLEFVNRTAETAHKISLAYGSINDVMAWYGAYFAGDDYTVTVNGTPVEMDQNGERDLTI